MLIQIVPTPAWFTPGPCNGCGCMFCARHCNNWIQDCLIHVRLVWPCSHCQCHWVESHHCLTARYRWYHIIHAYSPSPDVHRCYCRALWSTVRQMCNWLRLLGSRRQHTCRVRKCAISTIWILDHTPRHVICLCIVQVRSTVTAAPMFSTTAVTVAITAALVVATSVRSRQLSLPLRTTVLQHCHCCCRSPNYHHHW